MGYNYFTNDYTWLKLILLPFIIPNYEFAKLFNFSNMMDFFNNPFIYLSPSLTPLSLTLNQESQNGGQKSNPIIDFTFQMTMQVIEFITQFLENSDDDKSLNAEDDDNHDYKYESLLNRAINDIRSEGAQFSLNLIKSTIALIYSVREFGPDTSKYSTSTFNIFVSYHIDTFKSIIEMYQTFVSYAVTPYKIYRNLRGEVVAKYIMDKISMKDILSKVTKIPFTAKPDNSNQIDTRNFMQQILAPFMDSILLFGGVWASMFYKDYIIVSETRLLLENAFYRIDNTIFTLYHMTVSSILMLIHLQLQLKSISYSLSYIQMDKGLFSRN